MTEREKLKAEVLQKDLEAYRKLETWGSSLFFGAIALLVKQLVEWTASADTSELISHASWVLWAPALFGVAAFAFLRTVNARQHTKSRDLRQMFDKPKNDSLGILGLLLAVMPLALGHAASWFLIGNKGPKHLLFWLAGLTVLSGIGAHIWTRWPEWASGDTAQRQSGNDDKEMGSGSGQATPACRGDSGPPNADDAEKSEDARS